MTQLSFALVAEGTQAGRPPPKITFPTASLSTASRERLPPALHGVVLTVPVPSLLPRFELDAFTVRLTH